MSHDVLTISRLSGRDMSISSELLRATKPLSADGTAKMLRPASFTPKPSAPRPAFHTEAHANYIDLEADADFLRDDPSAFMLDPENAAHVDDRIIDYSPEERAEMVEGQDKLTSELRAMYMNLSASVINASDRAATEFVAIMRDAFGLEGVTVDDTMQHMSSVVLDLESLALLLSRTQHIPQETRNALLQHASTQLYDAMVVSRRKENNSKRFRDDIQRAMRSSNSGLALRPDETLD